MISQTEFHEMLIDVLSIYFEGITTTVVTWDANLLKIRLVF